MIATMFMRIAAAVAAAGLTIAAPAMAQDLRPGPVWPTLSQAQRDEVMRFGEDFKHFIGRAKSESAFVREATTLVEANGFKAWPAAPSKAEVRPGSRWY